MDGFDSIKLNYQYTELTLQAIRACQHIHDKAAALLRAYPENTLPLVVYEMAATAPMAALAYKAWLDEPVHPCNRVMQERVLNCIEYLRNELRANGMFEQYLRSVPGARPTLVLRRTTLYKKPDA